MMEVTLQNGKSLIVVGRYDWIEAEAETLVRGNILIGQHTASKPYQGHEKSFRRVWTRRVFGAGFAVNLSQDCEFCQFDLG